MKTTVWWEATASKTPEGTSPIHLLTILPQSEKVLRVFGSEILHLSATFSGSEQDYLPWLLTHPHFPALLEE
jgi:hypothetical protein